jgi:hypothetical protein
MKNTGPKQFKSSRGSRRSRRSRGSRSSRNIKSYTVNGFCRKGKLNHEYKARTGGLFSSQMVIFGEEGGEVSLFFSKFVHK